MRYLRDSIADAVDKQKHNEDARGRRNYAVYNVGDLVLLSTSNLPTHAFSNFTAAKLLPRFVGPFKVLRKTGNAYTLDILSAMKLHPTFYVGRHKAYRDELSTRTRSSDAPTARERPLPEQLGA